MERRWGAAGRVLGKGAFGRVYAVESPFVVKVISRKNLYPSADLSVQNAEWLSDTIQNEVRMLEELQNVRGILSLEDYELVYDDSRLVSEARLYFPRYDTDLYAFNLKVGLSDSARSHVFNQLLDALNHCHTRGIVHRDIKTSNILCRTVAPDRCEVVISDFGSAKKLGGVPSLSSSSSSSDPSPKRHRQSDEEEEDNMGHSTLVYSQNYRPFEYLAFTPASERLERVLDREQLYAGDIWALGCVWAELFLRRLLFTSTELPIHSVRVHIFVCILEGGKGRDKKLARVRARASTWHGKLVRAMGVTDCIKAKTGAFCKILEKLRQVSGCFPAETAKCEQYYQNAVQQLEQNTALIHQAEVVQEALDTFDEMIDDMEKDISRLEAAMGTHQFALWKRMLCRNPIERIGCPELVSQLSTGGGGDHAQSTA